MCIAPVSYTHLDVYKRQRLNSLVAQADCGVRTEDLQDIRGVVGNDGVGGFCMCGTELTQAFKIG